MATIHLKSNLNGDFIAPDKTTSKAKPKPVIVPEWLREYILARDRVLYKEGKSIEELKIKYGV